MCIAFFKSMDSYVLRKVSVFPAGLKFPAILLNELRVNLVDLLNHLMPFWVIRPPVVIAE